MSVNWKLASFAKKNVKSDLKGKSVWKLFIMYLIDVCVYKYRSKCTYLNVWMYYSVCVYVYIYI